MITTAGTLSCVWTGKNIRPLVFSIFSGLNQVQTDETTFQSGDHPWVLLIHLFRGHHHYSTSPLLVVICCPFHRSACSSLPGFGSQPVLLHLRHTAAFRTVAFHTAASLC